MGSSDADLAMFADAAKIIGFGATILGGTAAVLGLGMHLNTMSADK
ncbi:hypothetical protein [Rhodococcus kronopolitis]|uniref:Uncharacterized protein n=1 Tax=Rhodococcus kronopolitis TaxID=1460226 RepID=A0ABV9FYR8_9NOCA